MTIFIIFFLDYFLVTKDNFRIIKYFYEILISSSFFNMWLIYLLTCNTIMAACLKLTNIYGFMKCSLVPSGTSDKNKVFSS